MKRKIIRKKALVLSSPAFNKENARRLYEVSNKILYSNHNHGDINNG